MSADAVPPGARVSRSLRSSIAVADTRPMPVHGEVQVPSAWLCRVARLPRFFLNVFPPFITFLVVRPPLVAPFIVGTSVCQFVDLRVGGLREEGNGLGATGRVGPM